MDMDLLLIFFSFVLKLSNCGIKIELTLSSMDNKKKDHYQAIMGGNFVQFLYAY